MKPKLRIQPRQEPAASPPGTERSPDPPPAVAPAVSTLELRTWVEAALREKQAGEIQAHRTGAALLGIAAFLGAVLTFWFLYLALSLLLGALLDTRHAFRLLLSGAALFGLFLLHFKRQPRLFSTPWPVPLPDGRPPLEINLPVAFGQVLVTPEYFVPSIFVGPLKYAGLALFLAPHLASTALYAWQSLPRLLAIDIGACADVVVMLLGFSKRVPAADVIQALPLLDHQVVLRQLARLDAARFLPGDPPALTLADDFRRDLMEAQPRR